MVRLFVLLCIAPPWLTTTIRDLRARPTTSSCMRKGEVVLIEGDRPLMVNLTRLPQAASKVEGRSATIAFSFVTCVAVAVLVAAGLLLYSRVRTQV